MRHSRLPCRSWPARPQRRSTVLIDASWLLSLSTVQEAHRSRPELQSPSVFFAVPDQSRSPGDWLREPRRGFIWNFVLIRGKPVRSCQRAKIVRLAAGGVSPGAGTAQCSKLIPIGYGPARRHGSGAPTTSAAAGLIANFNSMPPPMRTASAHLTRTSGHSRHDGLMIHGRNRPMRDGTCKLSAAGRRGRAGLVLRRRISNAARLAWTGHGAARDDRVGGLVIALSLGFRSGNTCRCGEGDQRCGCDERFGVH